MIKTCRLPGAVYQRSWIAPEEKEKAHQQLGVCPTELQSRPRPGKKGYWSRPQKKKVKPFLEDLSGGEKENRPLGYIPDRRKRGGR